MLPNYFAIRTALPRATCLSAVLSMTLNTATAGGLQLPEKALEEIKVSATALVDEPAGESATQGTVRREQIEGRPRQRTGDLFETVPGLAVTQHTGDGKANQFFLRGFNLDHGTDLRTTVLGMPVNQVGHAHGQGYTDLNFIIPELISTLEYKKGPYFAEEGDFSSAGSVRLKYLDALPRSLASIQVGENNFSRGLLAQSLTLGPGSLLLAFERSNQDGPWEQPENNGKTNALARYGWRSGKNELAFTAMAYQARWTATDHVPEEAINTGLINRFGTLDPTSGGQSHRYSLSTEWAYRHENSVSKANAYLIDSAIDLYSNFTYFLKSDPTDTSGRSKDQFNQREQRKTMGAHIEHTLFGQLLKKSNELTLGLEIRSDKVSPVELFDTESRTRTIARSIDRFEQTSTAVFIRNATVWHPKARTVLGIRRDEFRADVNGIYDDDEDSTSPLLQRGGKVKGSQVSPKASLVIGPFNHTEFFVNGGKGFHSNDPRGVVTPTLPTPFLAASWGQEVGIRNTGLANGLQLSAALFALRSESELVFVGDAGTTEAKSASRRRGVELSAFYQPTENLIVDADVTFSRARFVNEAAGPRVPNSIEETVGLGVSHKTGLHQVGYRFRYLGPAPLDEAGSLFSRSSISSNLFYGYALTPDIALSVELFNLFDRKNSDIEYGQDYALPNAPGVARFGRTLHPAEPRTVRLGLTLNF